MNAGTPDTVGDRRRSAALWGLVGAFVVLTVGLAFPVLGVERPALVVLVAVAVAAGAVAGLTSYALEARLTGRGV